MSANRPGRGGDVPGPCNGAFGPADGREATTDVLPYADMWRVHGRTVSHPRYYKTKTSRDLMLQTDASIKQYFICHITMLKLCRGRSLFAWPLGSANKAVVTAPLNCSWGARVDALCMGFFIIYGGGQSPVLFFYIQLCSGGMATARQRP